MTDIDSSDTLIEKLLRETKASNYTSGTIKLVLLKCGNVYNSGKFDEALKVISQIEPEVREAKDFPSLSNLLALKANCFGNLLFLDKCKKYLLEAKCYAEKIVVKKLKNLVSWPLRLG